MAKRIGILGGISYESTIKYYELLLQKYYQKHNNYHYPEIIIYSLDFQKFTNLENNEDKTRYIEYIMQGIDSLQNAGADFILLAANSPHSVFKEVSTLAKVPLLSITETVARSAKREGMKKLLLLGIKHTMQSSFYQEKCAEVGMEIIVPSYQEQEEINRIIFEELVIGIHQEKSKRKLQQVISNYNVDGVILGCTELPLILSQEDIPVKLLDTLELHVNAALEYSFTS
ncbi:MAG: aspartate/glutamate racemase family protein [Candidatus Hodarchaeota archaeon]